MKTIKEREIKLFSRENLHKWALLVIALAASVPLMVNYCIDGVDVSFYLRLLERVSSANLYMLLPALLVRVGLDTEFVYKLFLFGLNFVTAVIAYRCFFGIFKDRAIGVTGSMLYVWTPYRLNDLYCRADLGEAVALCFLPVIFYGLYRGYQVEENIGEESAASESKLSKKRICSLCCERSWIILAAGYTLVFQAYLLSFLVIAGFTVLFCLTMWKKTFRKAVLILWLKTVAAFLVCNLWTVLIFLVRIREKAFTLDAFRGNMIQSGGVYGSVFLQLFFVNGSSFRTAETGTENIQPLGVGFAVTVGVLVYLWLAFVGRHKDKKDIRGIRDFGKGVGISAVIIAILATNSFPWDALQRRNKMLFLLAESLQSPARLMQVEAVGFVLLTCIALWQVKKWEADLVSRTLAIVIAILALVSAQYLTGDILRTREPRSLYGVEYGEPEGEERFLPENLDISPWDYGKYMSF